LNDKYQFRPRNAEVSMPCGLSVRLNDVEDIAMCDRFQFLCPAGFRCG
jgi:hypothetical protein